MFENTFVKRRHRVKTQQIEPRHAKVQAGDGPVVKSCYAERAPVAHAFGEHLPGVARVIDVVENNRRKVGEMLRFLLANTEGDRALQPVPERSANTVLHPAIGPCREDP